MRSFLPSFFPRVSAVRAGIPADPRPPTDVYALRRTLSVGCAYLTLLIFVLAILGLDNIDKDVCFLW